MDLTRRDSLRLLALAALVTGTPALAACSSGGGAGGGAGGGSGGGQVAAGELALVSSETDRSTVDPALAATGAEATHALAAGLLAHLEVGPGHGNAVLSPYSVAIALAMTTNGARGSTEAEMLDVLGSDDVGTLNDGLNALTAYVEGLAGPVDLPDGETGEILLNVASSLAGQAGMTWEQPFLDALATSYGAGLWTVDFAGDTEAARRAINAWVADETADRIPELLKELSPDVVLALLNALHFKAPWATQFEEGLTADGAFTTGEGAEVRVPLMRSDDVATAYAQVDDAVVVTLPYAGGTLAMTVVLPDAGAESAVWGRLAEGGLADLLAAPRPASVDLTMPRWETRSPTLLGDALSAAGMPTAFSEAEADFSGMTRESDLFIGSVVHEGWIAVDETGTEAAAATAVLMEATSAAPPATEVALDRPFLYCIHDVAHGTPLFVGWVDDPSI